MIDSQSSHLRASPSQPLSPISSWANVWHPAQRREHRSATVSVADPRLDFLRNFRKVNLKGAGLETKKPITKRFSFIRLVNRVAKRAGYIRAILGHPPPGGFAVLIGYPADQSNHWVLIKSTLSATHAKGPFRGPCVCGGEGGIRTHGRLTPTPDFESGTFDHSATSPEGCVATRAAWCGPRMIRVGVRTHKRENDLMSLIACRGAGARAFLRDGEEVSAQRLGWRFWEVARAGGINCGC